MVLVQPLACSSGGSSGGFAAASGTAGGGAGGSSGGGGAGAAAGAGGGSAGAVGDVCGDMSGLQKGAPWPMAGFCPTRIGRTAIPSLPSQGQVLWSLKLSDFGVAVVESEPVIAADGRIYVVSGDGALHAIDADGVHLWSVATNSNARGVSPAIGADGTIYFASGESYTTYESELYAVTPDGSVKWHVALGTTYDSAPVIGGDGTVYVTTANMLIDPGSITAVAPDGSIKWRVADDYSFGPVTLGLDGNLYAVGTPEPPGPGANAILVALRPDGTEIGRNNVVSGMMPLLNHAGRLYYVAGVSGGGLDLTALQLDGTPSWKQPLNFYLVSELALDAAGAIVTPILAEGVIGLAGFNPETGERLWVTPACTSEPVAAASGEILCMRSGEPHKVVALSAEHSLLWEIELPGYAMGPIIGDGRVIVVTNAGVVMAIGDK
jgi:outer membrane protein assembly factor BamB